MFEEMVEVFCGMIALARDVGFFLRTVVKDLASVLDVFLGVGYRLKLPSQGTSTGSAFEPRRESVLGGLRVASMRPNRFDFQPYTRASDFL